jgi:hypothetical protein
MAPQAALDQHIDLALEQLVQARWLANAGSDLGLSPAELREPPPQIVGPAGANRWFSRVTPAVTRI